MDEQETETNGNKGNKQLLKQQLAKNTQVSSRYAQPGIRREETQRGSIRVKIAKVIEDSRSRAKAI